MGDREVDQGPFDVPRLDKIVIDGDGADWGDRGFRVGVLLPQKGAPKPASDFDAGFRVGWDERGLLVLGHVGDDKWGEAADSRDFWRRDSVQLYIAAKEIGGYEATISPGMDPKYPEVRVEKTDHRKREGSVEGVVERLPDLAVEGARVKRRGSYTLEVLLPWANLRMTPKPGEEVGFMFLVNDVDAEGGRYAPRWSSSAAGWRSGRGLRLASAASAAVNTVVGTCEYERFRRARIRVDAISDLIGKPVALRSGKRVLARGQLLADGTRASFAAVLPMPPRGSPFGEMAILVDGKPLGTFSPLDADEERAAALAASEVKFRSYIFAGREFPECDFEQPSLLEDILGPYRINTIFYDRDYNIVTAAEKPGRYGAIVEVTPESGPVVRRYRTLFRMPRDAPRRRGVAGGTAELPDYLGIAPEVARNQSRVVSDFLRRVFSEAISRNAASAVVLAGLFETDPNAGEQSVYDDVFAKDRQWWVGLKRKYHGLDKQFAVAVARPSPVTGELASVLRMGTAAEAGMKPDAVEKIDTVCKAWSADTDEAFAVCLARRGVVFFHQAYGQRDGRPMTVNDKSSMASVTKAMGGVLMMMLVDQGLVNLDDPVSKYLPAWSNPAVKKPMTIRHLYLHRAGFSGDSHVSDDVNDVEEVLAVLYPYLKVEEQFEYATTGYTLAGKIIEIVSGESLPQFYKRHLLDPLGCSDCEALYMGFGVRSTPMDMARFGQMLVNRGAYGQARFFSEETFAKMLPPPREEVLPGEAAEKRGIGVRWYGIEGLGRRIIGHDAGSSATFRVDLDNELVIVMTRNAEGKNFGKYHDQFLRAIAESLEK